MNNTISKRIRDLNKYSSKNIIRVCMDGPIIRVCMDGPVYGYYRNYDKYYILPFSGRIFTW